MQRKKIVSLRLTESEFEQIKSEAEKLGYTTSDFIRSILLKKNRCLKNKKDTKKILFELNRIGNNLNQIAKYVNTFKTIDNFVKFSIDEILKELKKIDVN